MPQTRIYYVNAGLYVKPDATSDAYSFVHGVQSVSDNADIATQDISEFGQVSPYEIVEDTPTVTIDIERVLDGYSPFYLMATEGASAASLTGRQDQKCVVMMGIYDSSVDYVSGPPTRVVEYSGFQPASVSYEFNVDGPFTETVSMQGNYREWAAGNAPKYGTIPTDPTATGTDEPLALTNCSGGVQFKENLLFAGDYPTLLPTNIPGVSASGTVTLNSAGCPTVPVQRISVSVDLNREEVRQLGCRGVYARYAQFPVDVTTEIEILSQSGDGVNISELGEFDGCDYGNALPERIRVATDSGFVLDLGSRNKLNNISHSFGSTDGGNSTATFTYIGKSVMSCYHPYDPSAIVYSGNP